MCAVAALRVRQARVVPRFAAAEDAARLAEVMNFALATCVAAERFAGVAGRAAAPGWRPIGVLLLGRLAGEAGLGWLGQEPAALRALACEAERRIGLPLNRGPAASTSDAPPAEEATPDRTAAPQLQPATSATAPERTRPPTSGGEGAV